MSRTSDLEEMLCVRQSLRQHERENRHWLYEIDRAVDEIQGGYPSGHTEIVQRFVSAYLAGAA